MHHKEGKLRVLAVYAIILRIEETYEESIKISFKNGESFSCIFYAQQISVKRLGVLHLNWLRLVKVSFETFYYVISDAEVICREME